ncbi:MAG: sugar phosphate nucleotidyltransferase [Candidatus Neomarinimicrobiota bacterium]
MKLVIIAAGQGSRLRQITGEINKTLMTIGSMSIMEHLLANASYCGITEVVIVIGYRHQAIKQFLESLRNDIPIQTVYNPAWKQPNGISVSAAREAIAHGDDFLISMSDHIYEPALLENVVESPMGNYVANVGLDFDIDNIFDIDDGMKVSVDPAAPTTITAMSKTLHKYDAIDCGVFKCRYEFFDYLAQAANAGNGSLSDACNELMEQHKMGGVDIGDSFWLDIDTPESFEYCRLHEDRIASWHSNR